MAGPTHEFSGFTVRGIAEGLVALKFKDSLWPHLSQGARDTLEKVGRFKFHDGKLIDEVVVKLAEVHGPEAAASVMEYATRTAIEGVVAPVAKLYVTLKGNDPAVLFERFNDLSGATTRGISASWKKEGPTRGSLSMRYGFQVDQRVGHAWCGALRYVIAFCGKQGQATVKPVDDVHVVTLALEWR